jgi:TonB family protein
MQPHDSSRFRSPHPRPQSRSPLEVDPGGATPAHAGLEPELPFAQTRVVVAAPALLIEARFRDVPLASRLLRADEARTFTIGAARGADAPVNPAYLAASAAPLQPAGHVLVEPATGGFAINLAPAMQAELLTPMQVLPLRPDFGRAEAPLALPADACLRVSCGEVAFDVYAAEPAAAVPRPRFIAALRTHGRYEAGVALAFLALLLIVRAIPDDPRAVSLDDIRRMGRLTSMVTIPLDINSPEIERTIGNKVPGGGGAPAAKGEQGKAGGKNEPKVNGRRAVAGEVAPKDIHDVAGEIRKNSILAVLDGPHSGALGAVMDDKPALGPDATTVLGDLQSANIASAYGTGLGAVGTGEGGGGTGEHTIGVSILGTVGVVGPGSGPGSGPGRGPYGRGVGGFRSRKATTPDPILGVASVRGMLDKEIIRRIVRRHLNEVKYCYEQALARQPQLDGRMVVQFTIAGTGNVLASVVQSSTLRSPAVEMCVVNAVKRWEFPSPEGRGLAIVSYPFQFTRPTAE